MLGGLACAVNRVGHHQPAGPGLQSGQVSGYDGQMQVNILDAKNRLSQLVRAAQAGEDVVIANRGQPVVRLVAVLPAAAAVPAVAPGPANVAAWFDSLPALPAHARRTDAEIAADVNAERDAWD
jgi:prevent-host-death family protein